MSRLQNTMHTVNFISKLKLLYYFHSRSLCFLPVIPHIQCFIPITIKWSFLCPHPRQYLPPPLEI